MPNNGFGIVEETSVFCVKGEFPNIGGVPFVVPKGEGEDVGGLVVGQSEVVGAGVLLPKTDLGAGTPKVAVLPNAFGTEERFENADTGAEVSADAAWGGCPKIVGVDVDVKLLVSHSGGLGLTGEGLFCGSSTICISSSSI